MKFENTQVFNVEGAIRGMRNPLNSWDKSDSFYGCMDARTGIGKLCKDCILGNCGSVTREYYLGSADIDLAKKLIKAGPEHRKFLRQIIVSVDIVGPRYWWQEFDTYKVGVVSNSCSTMHTIMNTPFTIDMFETDEDSNNMSSYWKDVICVLEEVRLQYVNTKDLKYLRRLKQILPESFLQRRTITLSYENIISMLKQRAEHRLDEWRFEFTLWASRLPYISAFYCAAKQKD